MKNDDPNRCQFRIEDPWRPRQCGHRARQGFDRCGLHGAPRVTPAERHRQQRLVVIEPLSPEDVAILAEHQRPRTRGECVDGPRPCPWASCRYNLGIVKIKNDGEPVVRELAEADESCALDVADDGNHYLEEVAELLGVSREHIRQIEERAVRKLKRRGQLGEGNGE